MHTVAVLALDDVIAFDLATPIEVLGRVPGPDGAPAYALLVAGPTPMVRAGPVGLSVPETLDRLVAADTVIVPGRADLDHPPDPRATVALRAAAARGGGGAGYRR